MAQQEKFKSDFAFQKYQQQVNQLLTSMLYSRQLQNTKTFDLLSETQKFSIQQSNKTQEMLCKALQLFQKLLNFEIQPVEQERSSQIAADLISSSVVYDQAKKRKDLETEIQMGKSQVSQFLNYLASYTNIIEFLTALHKSQQQEKMNSIETEYLKQSADILEKEDMLHTDCCYTAGLLTKQCMIQHEINRVQSIVQQNSLDVSNSELQEQVDKLYNQIYEIELQDKINGINQRYVQLFLKQFAKNSEKKIDFEDLKQDQLKYNQTCNQLLTIINNIRQQLKTQQIQKSDAIEQNKQLQNIQIVADLEQQQKQVSKLIEIENKLQRIISQCKDDKQQDNSAIEILSPNVNMLELLHDQYLGNIIQYVEDLIEYDQNLTKNIQQVLPKSQQQLDQDKLVKFLQNINIENVQTQFSSLINDMSKYLLQLQQICANQEQKISILNKQKDKLQQANVISKELTNSQDPINDETKMNNSQQNELLTTQQMKQLFDQKIYKLNNALESLVQQKKDEIQNQKQDQIVSDQIANYFVDKKTMTQCMKLFDLQYCQECGRKQVTYLYKKNSLLMCDKCVKKIQNYQDECIKCQQL